MMSGIFYIFLLTFSIANSCYNDPTTCDERIFDRDSFVCVCDAEYCDVIGDASLPPRGSFKRVISSRDKYRFKIIEKKVDSSLAGKTIISVNYDREYQTIIGFGGAFTDSTGISVSSLSSGTQEQFMRSYFSKDGIEYNLCRIPIGGSDFSTHPYSYDEVEGDVSLQHFALASEDLLYKIPFIRAAEEMSSKQVLLFASPWSPPPWMKENGKHNGKGGLLRHMWDPYAQYLIRFIEEYEKKNISLWGISTINEPTAGFQDWAWNACAWTAEDMRDWIKSSFGPALDRAGRSSLNVLVYEHSRELIPSYPGKILEDEVANKYVDGVGVHWYEDSTYGPGVLEELYNSFPDKFILYTEACEGFASEKKDKVQLGAWDRAQNYSSSIIQSINHYSSGWVDWNMALNMNGGPNWAGNVVDAPIIINEVNDEFYKQPMFYAMGHFSKFVSAGSKRLATAVRDKSGTIRKDIEAASFRHAEQDSLVYIILNKSDEHETVSIKTNCNGFINIMLDPKSLETILMREC